VPGAEAERGGVLPCHKTRATNRKPRSRAERPCAGCGLRGPAGDQGALKPDQVTSSAPSVVKERSAAVPLAGPPRAAGVPAARGSRSAWPPRRIRDGTHESNPRARLRSIRCGRGVRRGARPAAHPFLSAAGNAKSRTVESKFQLRSENVFFKDLRRFLPVAALGGNRGEATRQTPRKHLRQWGGRCTGDTDVVPEEFVGAWRGADPATTYSRNFDRFLERIRVESASFNHRGGREAASRPTQPASSPP